MFYDNPTKRLWVAGGPTRTITAYDVRSGRLLYQARTGGGFLNDLVVSKDAVYVTDSTTNALYVVDLGKGRRLPSGSSARVLRVTGDYRQPRGSGSTASASCQAATSSSRAVARSTP